MAADAQRSFRNTDAKSQPNSKPSQRWTLEETRTLELCLMKYGIGQWTAILNTGLLPGKVIGQLNTQTQRLLGQQSLAVFSELRVDIERVRRDNEARQGVTRKGGIIINTAGKLTKFEKDERRRGVIAAYGLTPEQKRHVEAELQKIQKQRPTDLQLRAESYLLSRDVAAMTREEKLELLQKLRDETARLYRCVRRPTEIRAAQPSSRLKRETSTQVDAAFTKKPRRVAKKKIALDEELQVDPVAVERLVAMGYSNRHAIDALLENANELEAAAQWLILNCH